MAKVELKKPIVEEISASIKDAATVVLVDYRGLTVEEDTELRKQLREAGVSYKVYKNTFMNFAFKGTECGDAYRRSNIQSSFRRNKCQGCHRASHGQSTQARA